jgi:hypothetical protein
MFPAPFTQMTRRMKIFITAGTLVAICGVTAGSLALASGSADVAPIPTVQAASGLAAVFAAPPGSVVPSEDGLSRAPISGHFIWRRLPAIENQANLAEFDVGETDDGGVCIVLIDEGSLRAGGGTCFPSLRLNGDLQTIAGKTLDNPALVIGVVPDSVTSVTMRTVDGESPAQIDHNVVTWRAPVSDSGQEPTSAVVGMRDGSTIETGPDLAVQHPPHVARPRG